MKSIIAIYCILASVNTFAASILVESKRNSGFVPVEMAGTTTHQITSTGVIQVINNKAKTTVVGKLSPVALKNLVMKIKTMPTGTLQGEDGPMCADAPSTLNIVHKNGKEIIIKIEANCNIKTVGEAYELNSIIDSTKQLSSALLNSNL